MIVATGEGRKIDYPHPEILLRAIINVMKNLDVIEGELILPEKRIFISKRHEIQSTISGILHPQVKPGDYVSEGDILAEVTDLFNILKKKCISHISGIVGRVTTFAAI